MHSGIVIAVAIAAGILAQSLGRHLRLPGIVLLLAFGAALGPDGLAWVEPHELGQGLFVLVDFAVAVILFEGGLNLEWNRLRKLEGPLRGLLTVAPAVTWAGATFAAWYFLAWHWTLALLFGSLVVVTGPTVIAPLAREIRLRSRIKTVLEAEGVLIDPIGAFLAVLALHIALTPDVRTLGSGVAVIGSQLAFGAATGAIGGWILGTMLRVRGLVPRGLENVFTLGAVVLLFEATNLVVPHAGILSVAVAGMAVGNMSTRVDRDLREFKDQLTVLLVGLLFVLLAADVRLADIMALGSGGAAVVALLVLVIRPLAVAAGTATSDLTWREKLFVGWVAPRGIVAAAVASVAAAALDEAGLAGGTEVRAMVFLTIASTVVLAGATAAPLASILGLRLAQRNGVAILGANGLGLALGKILRDSGSPVTFVDNDPRSCQRASDEGYPVVFGDPLIERTMLRARIEEVGTVIGITTNDHLNVLFASQAADLFGVPRTFVAMGDESRDVLPEHVERFDGEVLFEGPHDKQRWDVRSRSDELEIVAVKWKAPTSDQDDQEAQANEGEKNPEEPPKPSSAMRSSSNPELFVLLALDRKKGVRLYTRRVQLGDGDLATAALYSGQREQAIVALSTQGWELVPDQDSDSAESNGTPGTPGTPGKGTA
ncbi:MAG: NhaP-type Na+/H+ or K+/H+ antiporter [Planctomycetota bacterium]|jgi:NhaP-type Na+/H+ or K+/H+ antiporter